MKINSSKLVEIISALAIVLSLIFLATELRQSNRIAIGTTVNELQRNANEINRLTLTDSSVRSLIVKMEQAEFEPNRDEFNQAMGLVGLFTATWIAVEAAHDNGLVTDEYFRLAQLEIERIVPALPGLRFGWEFVLGQDPGGMAVFQRIRDALNKP